MWRGRGEGGEQVSTKPPPQTPNSSENRREGGLKIQPPTPSSEGKIEGGSMILAARPTPKSPKALAKVT